MTNTLEERSTMEQLFSRFSHLSEAICDQLDDESLGKFKEVNQEWNLYLTEQKLYEVRIIKATIAKSGLSQIGDGWKEVLKESSKETLLNLKHAVQEFYEEFKNGGFEFPEGITQRFYCLGITPLHVVAGFGQVNLFETIYNKTEEKNPKNVMDETPLHYSARYGRVEICKFIATKIEDKNPKDNCRGATEIC